MKTVHELGRYKIALNRGSLYLRWWNPRIKGMDAKILESVKPSPAEVAAKEITAPTKKRLEPEAKRLIRTIAEPSERISAESKLSKDPEFGEVWLAYEQAQRKRMERGAMSKGRFKLLINRLDLYYRPHLWSVRMSKMGRAIEAFSDALFTATYSPSRGRRKEDDARPLSPQTIKDILGPVVAVCAKAVSDGTSTIPAPAMPEVAGWLAPEDRDPKGRYLKPRELGALIDAAQSEHILDLLLLEIGSAGRIGAVAEIEAGYVHRDLGVINLMKWGEIETNKRKPIVPITGPMGRILDRLLEQHGSGYILYNDRGRPIAKSLNGNDPNYTQIIQRLVERSGIDKGLPDGALRANWYSFRRTFADYLDERVDNAAISSVLGHSAISKEERRKLFERGSPMTDIYKRRKLAPVYSVAEALEAAWWPKIQRFTSVDLSSTERCRAAIRPAELMLADADGDDW